MSDIQSLYRILPDRDNAGIDNLISFLRISSNFCQGVPTADKFARSSTCPIASAQLTHLPKFSKASFSSVNWGEKDCIRIPVAFRLYLVKIIQILTN